MSEKYLSNDLGERESPEIIQANKYIDSYVSSSDDSENEIQDVCRSDVTNSMYYYKQDSADTNYLLKLIQRRRVYIFKYHSILYLGQAKIKITKTS
jgi:hypothetical protein